VVQGASALAKSLGQEEEEESHAVEVVLRQWGNQQAVEGNFQMRIQGVAGENYPVENQEAVEEDEAFHGVAEYFGNLVVEVGILGD